MGGKFPASLTLLAIFCSITASAGPIEDAIKSVEEALKAKREAEKKQHDDIVESIKQRKLNEILDEMKKSMTAEYDRNESQSKAFGRKSLEEIIVESFLSTNESVLRLQHFNRNNLKVVSDSEALFSTDIDSDGLDEIIAACGPRELFTSRYAFVVVLDTAENRYFKRWESPRYPGRLWTQDRATFGFKVLNSPFETHPKICLISSNENDSSGLLRIFAFDTNTSLFRDISPPLPDRPFGRFRFRDLDDDGVEEVILDELSPAPGPEEEPKPPLIYKWMPDGQFREFEP
jgi:hypothetical protein